MAQDAASGVNYYLSIEATHKSDLATIRQWDNLKVAFNENLIWVKDLNYVQVHSVEIKSIPSKTIYYANEGKLFLLNSLLPDRVIPSLLWSPIDRALPIQLPDFNHNYFGVKEEITTRLIPVDKEVEAVAMLTSINTLQSYIETAPQIRLQKIQWTILNNDKAVLIGKPMLPITGQAFWQRQNILLPTGYDLELFVLADSISNIINPGNDCWILWNEDNSYCLINKNDVCPLSLSSFRKSIEQLTVPQF